MPIRTYFYPETASRRILCNMESVVAVTFVAFLFTTFADARSLKVAYEHANVPSAFKASERPERLQIPLYLEGDFGANITMELSSEATVRPYPICSV